MVRKNQKEQRLAEKVGIGKQFEGEKIKLADIEGNEVMLIDFHFGISTFQEGKQYLTLQIELEGEKKVASTGGKVLVEAFHNINKEKDLPAPVIFRKVMSSQGRSFWTMG